MVEEKISEGFYHNHHGKRQVLSHKPKLRHAKDLSYCTDNAAMIAAAAYFHHQKNPRQFLKTRQFRADPNASLYFC
jgi:tRNA A37 threonylcarbamoyltransferase TsaD